MVLEGLILLTCLSVSHATGPLVMFVSCLALDRTADLDAQGISPTLELQARLR